MMQMPGPTVTPTNSGKIDNLFNSYEEEKGKFIYDEGMCKFFKDVGISESSMATDLRVVLIMYYM